MNLSEVPEQFGIGARNRRRRPRSQTRFSQAPACPCPPQSWLLNHGGSGGAGSLLTEPGGRTGNTTGGQEVRSKLVKTAGR